MGINIILYRLVSEDEGCSFKMVRDKDFDSIRYTGDRELNSKIKKEYFSFHEDCFFRSDLIYWRPIEFHNTKVWVKDNIPQNNRDRWLNVLDKIKNDRTYWFLTSY